MMAASDPKKTENTPPTGTGETASGNNKQTDAKKPSEPGAHIVEQGAPFERRVGSQPKKLAPAGKYRVTHGIVHFGYAKNVDGHTVGDRAIAYPGAIIELTAEEATPLVEAKTVQLLAPG